MKTLTCSLLATLLVSPAAFAQKSAPDYSKPAAPHTNPPPAVFVVDPPPPPIAVQQPGKPVPAYVYDQKPAPGHPLLISPEQGQVIINHFKPAFAKLGTPRLLIHVNRDLGDDPSGTKPIHHTESVEAAAPAAADTNAAPAVKNVEKNEHRADETRPPTSPADKQTVRDVERLFGRPFRAAGATLVDQKVAAELLGDKPIAAFVGAGDTPESQKDREAIGKVADAVIEIVISSKPVTTTTSTGEQTVATPEIHATIISLKDATILGQVSSSEVTAHVPPATLATYSVQEITEATALALMRDMTPAP